MDEASNTGGNRKPGTFRKGDPRINRKGRPKVFDELRGLSLQIAHEPAIGKDGEPIVINGHKVTMIEARLRQWWQSKDPRLQIAAMEIAFGKVPDKHEVTFGDSDIDAAIEAGLAKLAAGRKAEVAGESREPCCGDVAG